MPNVAKEVDVSHVELIQMRTWKACPKICLGRQSKLFKLPWADLTHTTSATRIEEVRRQMVEAVHAHLLKEKVSLNS